MPSHFVKTLRLLSYLATLGSPLFLLGQVLYVTCLHVLPTLSVAMSPLTRYLFYASFSGRSFPMPEIRSLEKCHQGSLGNRPSNSISVTHLNSLSGVVKSASWHYQS